MSSKRKKARIEALTKSKDIKGFYEEFKGETDRATAILGAAYLDELLLQLLTAYFVDDEKKVQELLSTEKPLGSFGARMRMAYSIGILAKEDFQDLKTIKGIRNTFAHNLHGLSFAEESIAKECMKLQIAERIFDIKIKSPREIFIFTILCLLVELKGKIVSTKHCQIPPPYNTKSKRFVRNAEARTK